MLAKDVQITGIDPVQYEHLVGAFEPFMPDGGERLLIVFFQENRVLHAVHSERGPVETVDFKGPGSLERLATEHNVDRVVCIESGAVRRIFTKAQASLKYSQSLWEQILSCRTAFKMELNSGIYVFPDPFRSIPEIPDFVLRLFRMFVPEEMVLVAGVMDSGRVWTSLVVGLDKGEVSLVTTTDSLEGMGEEFQDLRTAAGIIAGGTAARWGTPTAGVFMERAAFEQLLASSKPLYTFADLVRKQWIYMNPFPVRLKIALMFISLLKK